MKNSKFRGIVRKVQIMKDTVNAFSKQVMININPMSIPMLQKKNYKKKSKGHFK